jgi:hypothetical protein
MWIVTEILLDANVFNFPMITSLGIKEYICYCSSSDILSDLVCSREYIVNQHHANVLTNDSAILILKLG